LAESRSSLQLQSPVRLLSYSQLSCSDLDIRPAWPSSSTCLRIDKCGWWGWYVSWWWKIITRVPKSGRVGLCPHKVIMSDSSVCLMTVTLMPFYRTVWWPYSNFVDKRPRELHHTGIYNRCQFKTNSRYATVTAIQRATYVSQLASYATYYIHTNNILKQEVVVVVVVTRSKQTSQHRNLIVKIASLQLNK